LAALRVVSQLLLLLLLLLLQQQQGNANLKVQWHWPDLKRRLFH